MTCTPSWRLSHLHCSLGFLFSFILLQSWIYWSECNFQVSRNINFRVASLAVYPSLPSTTDPAWSCLFGLIWELAAGPFPTDKPAVFSTRFASVIIFCMQGSLMCNKCKWAMYILCFINSQLSLLLPATALPCQDSSVRPSVLGFLCRLHLISESCFYPSSVTTEATVLSSNAMDRPTPLMTKVFLGWFT